MNILVFNCGSSSQSSKVYQWDGTALTIVAAGKAANIETQTLAKPSLTWTYAGHTSTVTDHVATHAQAAKALITLLRQHDLRVDAVGHRFVHGGELFSATTRIDAEQLARLRQTATYAPIHNPHSLAVIDACLEKLGDAPQFAVFDTAFYASMPQYARSYAIPKQLANEEGLRKYGFHGLSYQYVSARAAALMNQPIGELKMVLCHLGTGGSSVTALKYGVPVNTSMGYSPLAGLVMSTRSGDVDPGVVLDLAHRLGSADKVSHLLNFESGLLGLSGKTSSLLENIAGMNAGDADCQLSFDVYAQRLKLYLGGFVWELGGADAIVFTDSLGTQAWQLRQAVCGEVAALGIRLDTERNRSADPAAETLISAPESSARIWVIPTDEERVIAEEVVKTMEDHLP